MISGTAYLVSALVVFVLVSAFKPFLEASILPVDNKDKTPNALHDPAVRLLAFVLGAASNVTIYLVYTAHHDNQGIFTAVMVGLGAALTAIGTYHLESANYFGTPTPAEVTSGPLAATVPATAVTVPATATVTVGAVTPAPVFPPDAAGPA